MSDNRTKVLAEVLSIDAWHKPFRVDGRTSSIHVEMSFEQGRLGGDNPDIPFTFKASLKRALLTIYLENPLEIARDTVARHIPQDEGERTKIYSIREKAKDSAKFGGKITPASLHLAAAGSMANESEVSKEDQVRLIKNIPRVLINARPKGSREYCWEILPGHDDWLSGQPWDPEAEPRMSVKSLSKIPKIEPAIRVSVSCNFDDIEIEELMPKSLGIKLLKNIVFNEINEAAAIQQLKLSLRDADLEFGKLDDRFSHIVIADLLASCV